MKLIELLCQSLHTENARILNFWDLSARGIGNSVGIGILVVFGELIRNVAGPAVLISIPVAGITAILAALCFSEFGVRFLKTETAYTYSYSYHGENVAFILGWALILEYIAGTASLVKGLITFADGLAESKISNFLNETVPFNWDYDFVYFDFISFVVVLLLVVPVAWKLADYTIFKIIFTLCNILLYVSVIIAGSFQADPKNWETDESTTEEEKGNFLPFGVLRIIKGAAIVYYAYLGFETVVLTGHEVKDPQKYLPYASLTSVFTVLFLYEGVAVILSLLCPYNEIIPTAGLPLAFEKVGWIAVKWIIVVGVVFGFQTSLFGAIFSVPKILNAMANDGLLFLFLNDTHSKFKLGVLLSSILMATLAGILTFQSLLNLTVIAALFVSTIIAIDIIVIRYIPEKNENIFKNNGSSSKQRPTAKDIVQQMFRFNSKIPSEVTENTVTANLFLFWLSSVSMGIVFGIFGDDILELSVPAIVSAVVFAVIILFSFGSIIAQPKSKIFSVFEVPLIPFTPCISIFLNNFLMMFLGPVNLVLFLIWMALGIIPHLIWYTIKYCQGHVGNSSLYEINKFNSLKLNESVWKIKSEKKSFYAGSVNHAFQEETKESSTEVISVIDEKKYLELKQAVIVEAPVLSEETQNSEQVTGTDEIIQWECVAEIHTEDEFQKESYELELVDDNYEFLSYVSQEPSRGNRPSSIKSLEESTADKRREENEINGNSEKSKDEKKGQEASKPSQKTEHLPMKHDFKEPCIIINDGLSTESEANGLQKEEKTEETQQPVKENIPKEKTQSPFSEVLTAEEAIKMNNINNNNSSSNDNNDNNNDSSDSNKMKDFKEKLNLFLKNQLNDNRTYGSVYNIKSRKNSISENSESDQVILRDTIKTLKKSEIKDKLDIILSKGPPKRASLQNSFNIKIKNLDKDNEAATAF